jgi:hypothetical protein
MKDLFKHFVRDEHGVWTCTMPAELQSPVGRVQTAEGARFEAGSLFMGVDVAKWLDEQLN